MACVNKELRQLHKSVLCEAKLQHEYMSQHGMVVVYYHPSIMSAAIHSVERAESHVTLVRRYSCCTKMRRSLSALPGTMLTAAA